MAERPDYRPLLLWALGKIDRTKLSGRDLIEYEKAELALFESHLTARSRATTGERHDHPGDWCEACVWCATAMVFNGTPML